MKRSHFVFDAPSSESPVMAMSPERPRKKQNRSPSLTNGNLPSRNKLYRLCTCNPTSPSICGWSPKTCNTSGYSRTRPPSNYAVDFLTNRFGLGWSFKRVMRRLAFRESHCRLRASRGQSKQITSKTRRNQKTHMKSTL